MAESVICMVETIENNYKVIHCNINEGCCDDGCCNNDFTPKSPVFIWFLLLLILLSYIYIMARCCWKKLTKRHSTDTPLNTIRISRANTQPNEMSLMLSFNPNNPRNGLERFNFDNVNYHVPFIPTTPLTPPPPYVTPTPPPTYNVAIHFPPIKETQGMDANLA